MDSVRREAEAITHFNYSTRYTYEGHYTTHKKIRCSLGFSDYPQDTAKLLEKLTKEGRLSDGTVFKLVKQSIAALGSKNNIEQQLSPDLFHYTWVFFYDLPILLLKNEPKIQELRKRNDQLGIKLSEEQEKAIGLELTDETEYWHPLVKANIINNIYVLNPEAPIPSYYIINAVLTLGLYVGMGVLLFNEVRKLLDKKQ